MPDLELGLAASARPWSDTLHRFLTDHGGARVRTVIMTPEDVVAESYDVLLIDDICSFLTPRLVEQARRLGRQVVGVFDPIDGADAKRRLLECGVDDVVESSAPPEEILATVRSVLELAPFVAATPAQSAPVVESGRVIVVGAPPGGCGATEVSLALGQHVGGVVLDADDLAPSIAQRIGLPLTPNLRTAIDLVHHRPGNLKEAVSRLGGFAVVAGLASGEARLQLEGGEVEAVVEELAAIYPTVVVNIASGLEGPDLADGRFSLTRRLIRRADLVVGIGRPEPVSLVRLVRWVGVVTELAPGTPLVLGLNRVGKSLYQRSEVHTELARSLPGVPLVFLPEDKRVEESAWAGSVVGKGPFRRGVARLAEEARL